MSRLSLRKAVAAGLGAALIGSGLTVGLGAGVASAYDASSCSKSGSVELKGYTITKTIEGDGKVGANGTVAVRITVAGPGGLVYEVRDFHPEGFEMTKTELNVGWVVGGQKWEDATKKATVSNGATRLGSTLGWTTAGKTVAMRVTYKVPGTVKPGEVIDAGKVGVNVGAVTNENSDVNVCMVGRIPNPVEAVTGSLGSVGLGSVGDLFGSLSGSIGDPSSPIGQLSDSLGG